MDIESLDQFDRISKGDIREADWKLIEDSVWKQVQDSVWQEFKNNP